MFFIKFLFSDGKYSYFGYSLSSNFLGNRGEQISLASDPSNAMGFETIEVAARVVSTITKWESYQRLKREHDAVAEVIHIPGVRPLRLHTDTSIGFIKRLLG